MARGLELIQDQTQNVIMGSKDRTQRVLPQAGKQTSQSSSDLPVPSTSVAGLLDGGQAMLQFSGRG